MDTNRQDLLPLYCAFAAMMAIGIVSKLDKKILIAATVLVLGCIVSSAVFALAAYFPPRAMGFATLLLLLSDLVLLGALTERGTKYLLPALCAAAAVVCAFSFILGAGDVGVVYAESRDREATIKAAIEAGEDSVAVHQYSGATKYSISYRVVDVSYTDWEWPNNHMAKYYGLKSITGLPPLN